MSYKNETEFENALIAKLTQLFLREVSSNQKC